MTRLRGRFDVVFLVLCGTLFGFAIMEAGARLVAVREERRQGRLDRDFARVKNPPSGAVVTLGQIIQKSDNPRIVYELRPRLDVVFSGGRVTTSDAGYRGNDAATPKPAGKYRILGVADSYMFGQGVSDGETYMARLPALMKDHFAGLEVETVNLAVPGFNTAMEVEMLRSRGPLLQPDLVLIEIVGNDLDLPNFLWNAVDPWSGRRLFLLDFVRARLRIQSTVEDTARGLTEAPHTPGAAIEAFSRESDEVPPQYASMVGLRAFEESIADLAEFGRVHHVPVRALTHGVWWEDAMLRALSKNGIPVLVLRSALRQGARSLGAPDYLRSPLAVSAKDLHPSALGHRLIAEELSVWIPGTVPHS